MYRSGSTYSLITVSVMWIIFFVMCSNIFQNNVGMHDPLIDREGFPRNDIDVYAVRMARHQIICKFSGRLTFLVRIK